MNIQPFSMFRFRAPAGFSGVLSTDPLFRSLSRPEVNP